MINDVRKFWLENQDGEIWNFTDEENQTFLESPAGLGISNNYGGYRLGNAEVVNYIQSQLLDINGTLLFYRNSRAEIYQDYFDFMKFIAKNSLLKLHYKTPNSFESYYRYCFVRQIDKTEIDNEMLVMRCPIIFATQTFWRNDIRNVVVVDNSLAQDGKKYPLERPYHYATSKLSSINVINRGNTDTSMRITITGASNNPTINVYDNNDVRYGAVRMLGKFDNVMVDSDDLNEHIVLEKNGSVLTAPYSYQDLSIGEANQVYVTFIKLKSGQSTLRFTNDGTFNGIVTIEWSDEYVSV